MDKCILTATSNSFFPALLNLLGSIKANYPNHPKIYVYSLDLITVFKNEIKQMDNVELIEMPHFCKFWRKCYTWKPYIFAHPKANLNLFLDAGTEVLRPLDEMFDAIAADNYFTVNAGPNLADSIPQEYRSLFQLENVDLTQRPYITSGIVGFKSPSMMDNIMQKLYDLDLCGLCLGFSAGEQHRNQGKNETFFVRGCREFRHEQTLLNILLYKYDPDFKMHSGSIYAGWPTKTEAPNQAIWNLRRAYGKLEYAHTLFKKHRALKTFILKTFLDTFMLAKNIKAKLS